MNCIYLFILHTPTRCERVCNIIWVAIIDMVCTKERHESKFRSNKFKSFMRAKITLKYFQLTIESFSSFSCFFLSFGFVRNEDLYAHGIYKFLKCTWMVMIQLKKKEREMLPWECLRWLYYYSFKASNQFSACTNKSNEWNISNFNSFQLHLRIYVKWILSINSWADWIEFLRNAFVHMHLYDSNSHGFVIHLFANVALYIRMKWFACRNVRDYDYMMYAFNLRRALYWLNFHMCGECMQSIDAKSYDKQTVITRHLLWRVFSAECFQAMRSIYSFLLSENVLLVKSLNF